MQPSTPDLTGARQRALNYWQQDGLPGLVTGVACLLGAVLLYTAGLQPQPAWAIAVMLTALVLFLVFLFAATAVVNVLKARLTYPRTGYATPPGEENSHVPGSRLTTLALAESGMQSDATLLSSLTAWGDRARPSWWILLTVVAACLITRLVANAWVCAATGLILGLLLWLASTVAHESISWIEIASLPATGIGLTAFQVSSSHRLAGFLAGGGAALSIAGALRLQRYLRGNPRSPA